jgi:hypothetical protein
LAVTFEAAEHASACRHTTPGGLINAFRSSLRGVTSGDQDVAHPRDIFDGACVEFVEACGVVSVGDGGPGAVVHFGDRYVLAVDGVDPGDVSDAPDERATEDGD